jgi:cell division septum initiation protein DivIVA
MLYDDEGKAYIEPPWIPEEQHLMYIVKDYRRMYVENQKLRNQNKQLEKSNKGLRDRNFRQANKITEAYDVINHCIKYMKKCGIEPSTFLVEFIKKHKSTGQDARYEETDI